MKRALKLAEGWLRGRFTGSVSTLPLALFPAASATV